MISVKRSICRQLKNEKIHETLLFKRMFIKHDVIINFGRKLMKIPFVQHANYWRMVPEMSRLSPIMQLFIRIQFNCKYCRCIYNKCMKSPFFRGWVKSTQKFVVEFMLLRHRVIRLPHTPLNP